MSAKGCGTILIIIFALAGLQFIGENKTLFTLIFLGLVAVWLLWRYVISPKNSESTAKDQNSGTAANTDEQAPVAKTILHSPDRISEKISCPLDEEERAGWTEFLTALSLIRNCSRIWIVDKSTQNEVPRYETGGASTTITRSNAAAQYVKAQTENKFAYIADENSFIIGGKDSGIVFLPKEIRIYQSALHLRFASADYAHTQHSFTTTTMIVNGQVPPDAEIESYTWKHVNLDGSIDNRYKDNPQIPICRYGQMTFSIKDTKIVFQLSKASDPRKLEGAWIKYTKFLAGKKSGTTATAAKLAEPDPFRRSISMPVRSEKKQDADSPRTLDDLKEMIKTSSRHASGTKPDASGGSIAVDIKEPFTVGQFEQAVEFALEDGQISTSTLQRRMKIGYARAGRITDKMGELGIIAPKIGTQPRACLITREEWDEMKKALSL